MQKNYGSDNEQFADLFNAVLFEMHYLRKKTLIYVPCLMKSQKNDEKGIVETGFDLDFLKMIY